MAAKNGTYREQMYQNEGRTLAIIKEIERDIERQCSSKNDGKVQRPASNCIHISESMPSGDSSGAKCSLSGNEPQSRWEATIAD